MNKWLALRNPPKLYEDRRRYFERIVGLYACYCSDETRITVDHKTTGKFFVLPPGDRTLESIKEELDSQTSITDRIEWVIDREDNLVCPARK
jgi:hypothetical protein